MSSKEDNVAFVEFLYGFIMVLVGLKLARYLSSSGLADVLEQSHWAASVLVVLVGGTVIGVFAVLLRWLLYRTYHAITRRTKRW